MISIHIDRYGVGYHMVVTKETKCDTTTVIDVVTSTISGAEMVSTVYNVQLENCQVFGNFSIDCQIKSIPTTSSFTNV